MRSGKLLPGLAAALMIAAGPQQDMNHHADEPEAGSVEPARPATLGTLQRIIRHFDFEEAEVAPFDMPVNFYRYVASHEGFPPFGAMQPTRDAAFAGNWSFGFSLGGGSLSARVPTGVLGVFPFTDYRVSVQIRTEDLTHAGARLVAYFNDVHGKPITASRRESALMRTDGAWAPAMVSLRGMYADAADLTVELQVMQPDQFRRAADADDGPLLSDTAGRAWFDDVHVRLAPRIDLASASPTNVFFAPSRPTLRVGVHDLVQADTFARLAVRDIDGRLVAAFDYPLGNDRRVRSIPLPLETFGWYDVRFDVRDAEDIVASAHTRIALARAAGAPTSRHRFAVHFPRADSTLLHEDIAIAETLGFGAMLIPAWSESKREPWLDTLGEEIERLDDAGRDVILTIHPPTGDRPAEGHAAAAPGSAETNLDEIVALLGPKVTRWQLGASDDPHADAAPTKDTIRFLADVRASLENMITDPLITVARAASDEPPHDGVGSVNVLVPHAIRPEDVAAVVDAWRRDDAHVMLTYEPLPEDRFSARQRLIDMTLRALWGWRAGAHLNIVRAPWHRARETRAPQPEPTLLAWSRLARHLDNGTFAGALDAGEGVHCWIIERPAPQDAALVVWKDHAGPVHIESILSGLRPFRVVDIFGNDIETDGAGGIDAAVDVTPVFIEHVNINLVRLQRDFTIDPAFVPAVRRVHEHSVVLRNPWETAISGKLILPDARGIRFSPRSHVFDIPSGGQVRMPVTLRFERDLPAERTEVEATIELMADTHYTIAARTMLTTGSPTIAWDVTWHLAPSVERRGIRDLVVTIVVTNLGSEPANLNASLVSEAKHQQSPIAALGPGRTTVRMFVIPEGSATIGGTEIRAALVGRDSAARLSRTIRLPRFASDITTDAQAAAGD